MAGYTKADFDSNYSINLDAIGLNALLEFGSSTTSHYFKPMIQYRWPQIVPSILDIQFTQIQQQPNNSTL